MMQMIDVGPPETIQRVDEWQKMKEILYVRREHQGKEELTER